MASGDELSIRAGRRRWTGCTLHFKALRVNAIFIIAVENCAKAHEEGDFLARVAIEIETECVEAFVAERVRSGLTCIRVDGHGHDGESGPPLKNIEVANIDA